MLKGARVALVGFRTSTVHSIEQMVTKTIIWSPKQGLLKMTPIILYMNKFDFLFFGIKF